VAQAALTVIGYAAGFYVGGPVGGQIGAAIGAYVGGQVDPPKIQGARLDDLKLPRMEYGAPIPRLQGRCRMPGLPVWISGKREISTTSGGKGGGEPELTTYTYECDVLYLVADNEIDAVPRVWMNGELIYSALAASTGQTIGTSITTTRWTDIAVHTGAAGQSPDPIYEAAVGAGNAPAYRGRGTVMVQGLQLGNSGQLPVLTFEVMTDASSSTLWVETATHPAHNWEVISEPRVTWSMGGATASLVGTNTPSPNEHLVRTSTIVQGGKRYFEFWVFDSSSSATEVGWLEMLDGSGNLAGSNYSGNYTTANGTVNGSPTGGPGQQSWVGAGSVLMYAVDFVAGKYWVGKNGTWYGTGTGTPHPATGVDGKTHVLTGVDMRIHFTVYAGLPNISGTIVTTSEAFSYPVPSGYVAWASDAELATVWTPNDVGLDDVVSTLCTDAGLTAGQIDVTALSALSVVGVPLTTDAPQRATLEALAAAYYFEAVESDKLYFRTRGGAVAASITSDDMAAAEDAASEETPVALERGNDVEVPARWAVQYINADDDYQAGSVYSDRAVAQSADTRQMQLGLVLTPSRAQGLADTAALEARVAASRVSVQLSDKRPQLEPTDVLTLTDEQGISYRARITQETYAAGVRSLEGVLDDASVLASSGTTQASTPSVTVAPPARTELLSYTMLDIPLLRDADDTPGHYAAMRAATSGRWPGATLYISADNTTFSEVGTVTRQATGGETTTALGTWAGGNTFDETSTVTVDIGAGNTLASSTRDALLAGHTNAMLVGDEIIQFRTATYVSSGVYTLSGLLRGRRGTEWAQSGHAVGERVVLLADNGILRVDLAQAEVGLARYYKPVTIGRALSTVLAGQFTSTSARQLPFSPTDGRVARDTSNDATITWRRRTRLSHRLLAAGIDPPLGETAEAYEVAVYASGAFATVVRTISAATASASYTAAQQTADGLTPGATLYLRIYQISAAVGRGYSLEVSA
jgi:hypothetical protein